MERSPMTLKKLQIVSPNAEHNGFTRKKSSENLEILLELIKSTLESGSNFLIAGFGKFCVKDKRERKGRKSADILAGLTGINCVWINEQ
jgi:integration host factor subunit alpha